MNYGLIIITIIQAVMFSAFLTAWFEGTKKQFLMLLGVFCFVLFPLTQIIPKQYTNVTMFIIVGILYAACRMLFHASPKRTLWAIFLYWIPLPIIEIAALQLLNMFFGNVMHPLHINLLWEKSASIFYIFQLLCTAFGGVFYLIVLPCKRKYHNDSRIMLALTIIFASIAALANFAYFEHFWQYFGHIGIDAIGPLAMLLIFDALFVIFLRKYAKEKTELTARKLIQDEYLSQFAQLKDSDISRERLRQFRHDLINELEKK